MFFGIDTLGKVDYVKQKLPWLDRILAWRSGFGVLLLLVFFMLVVDGYELFTKEVPEIPSAPTVVIKPPLPPVLTDKPPTDSDVLLPRLQKLETAVEGLPEASLMKRGTRFAGRVQALNDRYESCVKTGKAKCVLMLVHWDTEYLPSCLKLVQDFGDAQVDVSTLKQLCAKSDPSTFKLMIKDTLDAVGQLKN